jgi:hypothetical protein
VREFQHRLLAELESECSAQQSANAGGVGVGGSTRALGPPEGACLQVPPRPVSGARPAGTECYLRVEERGLNRYSSRAAADQAGPTRALWLAELSGFEVLARGRYQASSASPVLFKLTLRERSLALRERVSRRHDEIPAQVSEVQAAWIFCFEAEADRERFGWALSNLSAGRQWHDDESAWARSTAMQRAHALYPQASSGVTTSEGSEALVVNVVPLTQVML